MGWRRARPYARNLIYEGFYWLVFSETPQLEGKGQEARFDKEKQDREKPEGEADEIMLSFHGCVYTATHYEIVRNAEGGESKINMRMSIRMNIRIVRITRVRRISSDEDRALMSESDFLCIPRQMLLSPILERAMDVSPTCLLV